MKLRQVTDILMIGFVLVFPHVGHLPIFIYPFVVLGILWVYLRLYKEGFKEIGFSFKKLGWQPFALGSALGLAYACLVYWLIGPLLISVTKLPKANIGDFNFVKYSVVNYVLVLVVAWFIGVPYEEIIFRGFILTRIKAMIGRSFALGALITSVLFGLYHVQQGASGVINSFIFSLVVCWLYKLCKGNIWYCIFFHAMYDTFMLTALRMGYL